MSKLSVVGTHRPESALILGGGIAGLASALALRGQGLRITVVERDPEPPDVMPKDAFDAWSRPGVPQFRHTHFFLARLHAILRREHPELLAELAAAGVIPGSLDQLLPAKQAASLRARPGDADLVHIWGRRATLEYVLRRHLQRRGDVDFVHDTSVLGLQLTAANAQLRVGGAQLRGPRGQRSFQADLVVDALGVRSKSREWLNAGGAGLRMEREPSPCGYYCRHYKQVGALPEPPRRGTGASLDYLVFGMFFAEDDTFSIAITCPELEAGLLEHCRHPEGFDEICRRIPVLRQWLERSVPISRVLGGASLQNRWHHYGARDAALPILGFFPVGDAYVQTNPIYGRGCASAFVQAQLLAEAVRSTQAASVRARRYHASVWRELRPHFEFCLGADAAFVARARRARGEPVSALARAGNYLYDVAFLPAIEDNALIAREWIKTQQMTEVTPRWRGSLTLLAVLLLWLQRVLWRRERPPQALGPSRHEMLEALGRQARPRAPTPIPHASELTP